MTEGIANLTSRIEHLEKSNRRLKGVLTAIVVALVGVVGLGAISGESRETLTAERFIVIDGEGRTRAMLGTRPEGDPILVLIDHNGKNRLQLALREDAPGYMLADEEGRIRFHLSLREGEPRLGLFDEDGKRIRVWSLIRR